MRVKRINICDKIINIVLNILIGIVGIILFITIYNNIQVKILGNDYSSFFGYSIFEVQTGSMLDTIEPSDWIIVKYAEKIDLDDIITYEKDGEFITHRVIESYKGTYVTRGDANASKDEPISQEQIVGKVVKILPHFGTIRKTFFNRWVLITLIITLYLFSFVIHTNKKEIKDEKVNTVRKVDVYMEKIFEKIMVFIKNIKKKLSDKNNEATESTVEKPVVELPKEEKIEVKAVEVNDSEKVQTEEDLDKTLYFRMVPVDKLELDNTYLQIAETELEKDKPTIQITDLEEDFEKDDDTLIKSNLELLQNKRKRFKNIVEKAIFIKKEEINEIIDILNKGEKYKTNESTIKEEFLNTYIDARYYNFCGDVNAEYNNKNKLSKIDNELKIKADSLLKKYSGNDNKYDDKVKKYTNIFILINNLEQINELFTDLAVKRESYKNKIVKCFSGDFLSQLELKNMINSIIKTQRVYRGMVKCTLDKLQTNTFEIDFNKITNQKQLFAVELIHNISFSKVYSDYIVDKTYSEGIIAEDKVMVLMSLLLNQVVNDMFVGNFNQKYLIYVPATLYSKNNKLDKLFKMFEDEHAKNSIIVVIEYEELIKNKKVIKDLRKEGYRFALVFDDLTRIKAKEQKNISIADYLFIDKKLAKTTDALINIPVDFHDKIIYDDIKSKVGNFGGE